jgi:putative ABC transport system permease protein
MTARQVMRMVRREQGLLLGLALLIGAGIAAATLLPMVKGLTGSASPYIPFLGWVALIGGVLVLGFGAALPSARRALRMPAVDAAGVRE